MRKKMTEKEAWDLLKNFGIVFGMMFIALNLFSMVAYFFGKRVGMPMGMQRAL